MKNIYLKSIIAILLFAISNKPCKNSTVESIQPKIQTLNNELNLETFSFFKNSKTNFSNSFEYSSESEPSIPIQSEPLELSCLVQFDRIVKSMRKAEQIEP